MAALDFVQNAQVGLDCVQNARGWQSLMPKSVKRSVCSTTCIFNFSVWFQKNMQAPCSSRAPCVNSVLSKLTQEKKQVFKTGSPT